MTSSFFSDWTRRRFAAAAGAGLSALLGRGLSEETVANDKNRSRRCRRLRQPCKRGEKKKRCCKKKHLVCGEVLDLSGHRCCRPFRALCEAANECCGALVCDQITGLGPETRCCSASDGFCTKTEDCCEGFACNTADQQCVEI
jgi:hypothetical protein